MERFSSTKSPVLILSGTGKTGRRVASRLTEKGVPVRVGSRSSEIPFDWDKRETWAPAMEGVSAAYVAYHSDLAFPGALDAVRTFSRQAAQSGIRKLVLLSGRGEPAAELCEREVQNSGAVWTIVRASWFNQNFNEGFFQPQIAAGYVPFLSRGVTEPFIDADDIAEIAAAAFVDKRHEGKLYEVTGPRLLKFEAAVETISKAAGRKVRYEDVPAESYIQMLLADGVPQDYAHPLVELFGLVLDGRNSSLADGVQSALGREPIDFSIFVKNAAAAGVWSAPGL